MKKTTLFCIFAILFIFTLSAFAQTPEIVNGLNYLYATQNPDGSWDAAESSADGVPATVATIGALQELDETLSQNYIDAVLWLQSLELDMSDDISNRLNVLAAGDSDRDMLLSFLDGIYSGAWGGYEDFEANNLIQ